MSNLIYSTYRDLDVQFFLQALLNKSFRFLSVRCDRAKCCILYDHFMKKTRSHHELEARSFIRRGIRPPDFLTMKDHEIRTERQLQI